MYSWPNLAGVGRLCPSIQCYSVMGKEYKLFFLQYLSNSGELNSTYINNALWLGTVRECRQGLGLAFFIPKMNFYKTTRWKKKRAAILRRDKYLCQISKRYGLHVEAVVVHHIFPLEYYPELRLADFNLISLSKEMHNRLHDRDTHELTEEGLALQRRYYPQYKQWCEEHSVAVH